VTREAGEIYDYILMVSQEILAGEGFKTPGPLLFIPMFQPEDPVLILWSLESIMEQGPVPLPNPLPLKHSFLLHPFLIPRHVRPLVQLHPSLGIPHQVPLTICCVLMI